MRKRSKQLLPVLTLAAVLLLGGCAAKSAGGTRTQQGMEALENGDYDTALTSFQEAVSDGEDTVMAYRGLGLYYIATASYDEAADAFRTALSAVDSKMPETKKDLRLYLTLALLRGEHYEEVISQCAELTEESGEMTETAYYLGCAYLGQGDESRAKESFDSAVALAPDDYTLYLQIYQAFEKQSLTAVGSEYLQQALSIQPETDEDAYRLGEIYYYLGQYDTARSVIDEAVQNGYEPALELLGEIYIAQEDYDHALAVYQSLLQSQGETPAAQNGLALCAIASGDYESALSYIETGLALDEEDGKQELRFNEIVVYEKMLDFETALIKAESYAALYPTDENGQKELKFLQTQGS